MHPKSRQRGREMTRKVKTRFQSYKSSNRRAKIPPETSYNVSGYNFSDDGDASPSIALRQSNSDEFQQQPTNRSDASYDVDSNSVTDASSPGVPESVVGSGSFNSARDSIINNITASNSQQQQQQQQSIDSQATSYINVAPLPVFRGVPNECPIMHLSRFIKVCRANNAASVDMMMRIFPVTLENEAALWYDLNIESYLPSLSWDDVKSSFLEAYHRIELDDRLRSELMMLNQGGNEPVRSYFLRLQWILRRWPAHNGPLSDNLLKGIFIDGLMENFRNWIIPQKPNSLNEALRLAFIFEQVKSIRTATIRPKPNVVVKCGFCEGSHEERSCEVKNRMRDLWTKVISKNKQRKGLALVIEKSNSGSGSNYESDNKDANVAGKNEIGRGEAEEGTSLKEKKGQCQCWKHQCWKKNLERNSSLAATRNSIVAD